MRQAQTNRTTCAKGKEPSPNQQSNPLMPTPIHVQTSRTTTSTTVRPLNVPGEKARRVKVTVTPPDPTAVKTTTQGPRVDREPAAQGASTLEKLRGKEGSAATRQRGGRTIPRKAAGHVDGSVAGRAAAGGEAEAPEKAGRAAPHVGPPRAPMAPLPLHLSAARQMVRKPVRASGTKPLLRTTLLLRQVATLRDTAATTAAMATVRITRPRTIPFQTVAGVGGGTEGSVRRARGPPQRPQQRLHRPPPPKLLLRRTRHVAQRSRAAVRTRSPLPLPKNRAPRQPLIIPRATTLLVPEDGSPSPRPASPHRPYRAKENIDFLWRRTIRRQKNQAE